KPDALRGLFRVSFESVRPVTEGKKESAPAPAVDTDQVAELETALKDSRERHQGAIEELETANEELRSFNEEMQSTHEEMQSTNEELEPSKEELQSLNEELHTINSELQCKVDELSRANDDMTNLLNSTEIATIFLDEHLNLKRYTEQAKRL